MGIPCFYRWITLNYPRVSQSYSEELDFNELTGFNIPLNLESQNINGVEFDNFYIDLNGIVHPCCHANSESFTDSDDERILNIFRYLDRLLAAVKPREMVFIALDGVAPAAKMNQQRSRRFRQAKNMMEYERIYRQLAVELKDKDNSQIKQFKKIWNSNAISPGTKFMDLVAQSIRYYINYKIANDRYWSNIKFVFSDSNVPGEGEHKIIEYIRSTILNPYVKRTHLIHSKDADLIILGLALHRPFIYILREGFITKSSPPNQQYSKNQNPKEKNSSNSVVSIEHDEKINCSLDKESKINDSKFMVEYEPLELIKIDILRDYLKYQFHECVNYARSTNKYYYHSIFERIVDDYISIMTLVGNDFLPHIPALSIQSGSLNLLLALYIAVFDQLNGFLVDNAGIDLVVFTKFMSYLSVPEIELIKIKSNIDLTRQQKFARQFNHEEKQKIVTTDKILNPNSDLYASGVVNYKRFKISEDLDKKANQIIDAKNNKETVNPILYEDLESEVQIKLNKKLNEIEFTKLINEKMVDEINKYTLEENLKHKNVIFGTMDDFMKEYYTNYFGLVVGDENEIQEIADLASENFITGLSWVFKYYTQALPSWEWYYPYFYAPCLTSIYNFLLTKKLKKIKFSLCQPLSPFQQLLAILPPYSYELLPQKYWSLMLDDDSPLMDFYPKDFYSDPAGAQREYLWVIWINFIQKARLIFYSELIELELNDEEKTLNGKTKVYIFKHNSDASDRSDKISPPNPINEFPEWQDGFITSTLSSLPKFKCFSSAEELINHKTEFQDYKSSRFIGVNKLPSQLNRVDIIKFNRMYKGKGFFSCNVAVELILSFLGGKEFEKFMKKKIALYQNEDKFDYEK